MLTAFKWLVLLLPLVPLLASGQFTYPRDKVDSLQTAGAYAPALKINSEYLSAVGNTGNCKDLPLALYKSGELLDLLKNRAEAYRLLHQGLRKAIQCGNDSVEWLATRYLGGYFFSRASKDSALYYLTRAYQMIKDKHLPREISSVTGMLGETMTKLAHHEGEGLRYYKISVDYAVRSGNYFALGYAYLRYGAYLVYRENCAEGIPLVEKSLELFSINKDVEGEVWALTTLTGCYLKCNHTQKFFVVSQRLIAKQDSLFTVETARQTAEYQTLYETDKKARENLQLTKDNQLKNIQIENEKAWRRNLFIAFAIGLVLVSLLFIAVYRQYTLKKQRDLENKLQAERARISRELHDNIGTQLSQLSSSLDWARNKTNPVGEAEHQAILDTGLQTTREVINDLRTSIWALKKTKILFTEFADKLKTTLKDLTYAGKTIPILFEEQLNGHPLGSEEALDLLRICQEAVNNALRHSGCTQIHVALHAEGLHYDITVRDDGIGFNPLSVNPGHYGIEHMKERARQLSARITIRSEEGKGTVVIIAR